MNTTKHIIKRLHTVLAVLLVVALLFGCGTGTAGTWDKNYDLGMRYLSEGNYEEAVMAFLTAIEIDPKRPEAYEKAAEAYVGLGDIQSAVSILQEGIDATGAEALQDSLISLQEEKGLPSNEAGTNFRADETQSRPLIAEDLIWIVEPIYRYDDVEPIWAEDFSDFGINAATSTGNQVVIFADGKEDIKLFDADAHYLGSTMTEMNFPEYSCADEYYQVFSGNQNRLFYMPSRIDSGAAFDSEARPFVVDKVVGISAYAHSDSINSAFKGEQNDIYQAAAPWNILYRFGSGYGGFAHLVQDQDTGIRYFVYGVSVNYDDEVKSLREISLHKPYCIMLGEKITRRNEYYGQDGINYYPNEYYTQYEKVAGSGYAYISPNGTLITDYIYENAGAFSEGIAACQKNGKWGYIDDHGTEITDFIYDAPWKTNMVATGWVPGTYEPIYESVYEAYPCTSDTMVVSKDGQMGVLYRDGSLLIEFGQFEDLAPAWNNQLWAKKDGKWGLLDLASAKQKASLSEWDESSDHNIAESQSAVSQAADLTSLAVQPETVLSETEYIFYRVTAEPSLILRKGPGTNYEKIDMIPYGTQVKQVGFSTATDEWIVVQYGNQCGWVFAEYLEG